MVAYNQLITPRPAMFLDTRCSILPVLLLTFESSSKIELGAIRDGEYLGTGFFIWRNETVAFVTARHVVDVELRNDQRIGVGHLSGDGKYWWDYFEYDAQSDLGYARFWPEQLPDFIKPLHLLPADEDLFLGLEVVSFGFPFTGRRRPDTKTVLHVKEVFFSGHIACISDREELADAVPRPFSWNYAVTFDCPNGLSGAPLLTNFRGEPRVCGMVFANQRSYFRLEEHEEEESEGRLTRHEFNRVHHFGLASGHSELWGIPELEEKQGA